MKLKKIVCGLVLGAGLIIGCDSPASSTTQPPAAAPAGVNATVIDAESYVEVLWQPVAGATSYSILRQTAGAGNFDSVGVSSGVKYHDVNIKAGEQYAYQVKALNSAGASVPSSPTALVTAGDFIISSPKGGDIFHVGDTIAVRMSAIAGQPAGIEIIMGNKFLSIPGLNNTFSPMNTPVIKFPAPAVIQSPTLDANGNYITVNVSMISDSLKIRMFNYSQPIQTFTTSEGYFSIKN